MWTRKAALQDFEDIECVLGLRLPPKSIDFMILKCLMVLGLQKATEQTH